MLLLRSMSIKPLLKAAALMLLPWLAWSCQWMTEDFDGVIDGEATHYINVTISVSASSDPMTRAVPEGDEDGDGLEKGNDRENNVNDITLIFYQDGTGATDGTGINTNSDAVTVLCVKRYEVHPVTNAAADLPANHAAIPANEVLYSTGNQRLKETELQPGETYRVLVVANAVVNVKVGDKIKDVRDLLLTSVYKGSGVGINATDFVMSSERDAVVTLSNPTITTTNGENRFIYYFDCIHIERLAARIDYCTKGSEYDSDKGGYKYGVRNSDDYFVVTKVTPFNLYNEQEYLFKHVQDNWTSDAVTTYLANETGNNYVVDPNTGNKYGTNTFCYLNPIAETFTDAVYPQVMNYLSTGQRFTDSDDNTSIIIAYPRENTLMPTSQLKKFATGIAFEIDYYAKESDNTFTRSTNVYYHYLRHQGEQDSGSYQAKQWEGITGEETGAADVPMNFGVVRNNIYRVSIESSSEVQGKIKIKVEETKWRHVDNPTIYL